MMFFWFVFILHLTISQEVISPYVFSDCKHLILPARCQCYHSGYESQLRCLKSELHSLPKLPNNMRWNALDFSFNYITSVDNYVFADIYVEKIYLNANYLRRIETTAFDQIKNLKQLYINNNQLKDLHPTTLISPGASLEIFDASYNPFQYLDIGQILLNLSALKELHLVACQLNDTSIYTLLKLIQNTTDEYNETIVGRRHHQLEILDLSYNNLTTICYHLFDGLYNLIELRLNHNMIRLVDNNFLRSVTRIKILNLAHNSLQHVPKLLSRSLEVLNFSSNQINYISDYFASNLPAIRLIDFDYNPNLNNTSLRAFCFLNIFSLEKLTFRSNNILSLDTFTELLCRLTNATEKRDLIDINNNINLKCNCTLMQFQKLLNKYNDLTCNQQGQDRYYISTLTSWFSNCQNDACLNIQQQTKSISCNWADAERAIYEGTCEAKLKISEKKKKNKSKLTSTIATIVNIQWSENITDNRNFTITENATINQTGKALGSNSISMKKNIYLLLIILFTILILQKNID
ncbi:unnamed protein product [Rotaria socialis]|uniref:Uncharacterized protein n=1 Tax=Rotaria socialis TaxID=392032 RepID=A0A819YBG3_9BILA|nr:unnamed protein product [Rotaria socialis]CAF3279709.1 unnamed protein product [Rotaria socialis]CAF4150397.1 unnamed protein product [Rotaria socialis]CAF4264821.1 unnamed protein product [Rotaria socialis]